jgi:TonB family protein
MKRILFVLVSLLLVAPYQAARADSQLRDFFPRYADVKENPGYEQRFEIRLVGGDAVLIWENRFRHVLIEDVRSVNDARTRRFNISGDYWSGVKILFQIEGTLNRFTWTHGNSGKKFVVHPMSREKFAEYLEARRNNVGQPFDSNEWLEKNGSSDPSISAQVQTSSPESDDNNFLPPTALPPCPTSGYFDNCFGTQTFASGNKYVGEIKDGKFHGQGTFTYANGDKYVGEFKGGKFHGQGTFTWVDGGKKLVGEYKQGKKWEGIKYLASGRVFGTYSNGKWCQGCKPTVRQLAIVDEINSSSKVTETKPKEDKTESEAVSAFGAIASAIKQKISENWSEPGDFSGLSVEFLVKVDREGNVLLVKMTRSSGDARLDESAENAIFKASPLPFPGEARFYEYLKEFNFIFKPEWFGRTSQNNRETEESQDKQKQFSVEAQSGGEPEWVEWRLGQYAGQYRGELKNGAPNGYGVFSVRRKKTDDFPWVSATISGRWKDGAPEGKVNVSLEGDDDEFKSAQYAGEMNAVGEFHGYGVLTIEANEGVASIVGTWKDDKPWNANVWADGEKVWEYIEGEDPSDNRSDEPPVSQKPSGRLIGTGTGFAIDPYYIVTAEHVLSKCSAVNIRHGDQTINGRTVATDASNDLGLIKLQKSVTATAKLRSGGRIRLGDMVANYGFPLFGEISTSATTTKGNVNNLSGPGNDSTMFQFDAPTQPGNSGGPLLDQSGNVVGVVSSQLSKRYAENSDHIAQNVNFAVKSSVLENFLETNNIPFETARSTKNLTLADLAQKAEAFTVLVGCWE